MRFLLLEDDSRRVTKMKHVIAERGHSCEWLFYDNAPDLVAALPGGLPGLDLILLDHDLGPNRVRDGQAFDPGCGRDVSKALAVCAPMSPVLIHSTNATGAAGMKFDLIDGGWNVRCVAPYGDLEWIEEAWLPIVRLLLRI